MKYDIILSMILFLLVGNLSAQTAFTVFHQISGDSLFTIEDRDNIGKGKN